MDLALKDSIISRPIFLPLFKRSFIVKPGAFHRITLPAPAFPVNLRYSCRFPTAYGPISSRLRENVIFDYRNSSKSVVTDEESGNSVNVEILIWLKRGILLAASVCGVLELNCRRVFAVETVVNSGYGVLAQSTLQLTSCWPKVLQVLRAFKDQGLILAALVALSAFFSMAETAITTLWPWKVRELAEKESEGGVFTMIRSDVTRFFTTILIGTTVVNIAATALVTKAATTIFGEAGVSASTGVMTVAILLLTEITPKSVAVHNATEIARFVVRPVAWLSVVLYPIGRVFTYLSVGLLKMLGLKAASEPIVTEDELKLMLRGAESSGAIEEEEQVVICNIHAIGNHAIDLKRNSALNGVKICCRDLLILCYRYD